MLGFMRGLTIHCRYNRQLILAVDGGTLGLDWFDCCDAVTWVPPVPSSSTAHVHVGGAHPTDPHGPQATQPHRGAQGAADTVSGTAGHGPHGPQGGPHGPHLPPHHAPQPPVAGATLAAAAGAAAGAAAAARRGSTGGSDTAHVSVPAAVPPHVLHNQAHAGGPVHPHIHSHSHHTHHHDPYLPQHPAPGSVAPSTPILLVCHGINGGSHEGYVKWVCAAAACRGWRAVVLNYRGCNGLPFTAPRGYAATMSHDVFTAVYSVRSRFPDAPLLAVGYSLGGLKLTKYLAEADAGLHLPPHGLRRLFEGSGLAAAAVVSSPVSMWHTSANLSDPTRVDFMYNLALAYKIREHLAQHREDIMRHTRFDVDAALDSWTMTEIEEKGLPMSFGFANRQQYYEAASSLDYLPAIETPTLLLLAEDDPFLGVVPDAECSRNPNTLLALTKRGGHVAFLQGAWPLGEAYMDEAVLEFFASTLQHLHPPHPAPHAPHPPPPPHGYAPGHGHASGSRPGSGPPSPRTSSGGAGGGVQGQGQGQGQAQAAVQPHRSRPHGRAGRPPPPGLAVAAASGAVPDAARGGVWAAALAAARRSGPGPGEACCGGHGSGQGHAQGQAHGHGPASASSGSGSKPGRQAPSQLAPGARGLGAAASGGSGGGAAGGAAGGPVRKRGGAGGAAGKVRGDDAAAAAAAAAAARAAAAERERAAEILEDRQAATVEILSYLQRQREAEALAEAEAAALAEAQQQAGGGGGGEANPPRSRL
ncbi:hypothetical protein HYH03_003924 [Edaphochlamys debaryana]|uniref:AB hydrolase-1 domain-containing protein n=1 Tax=Edaphochlamys debaryana TaxID=47281 RepID=A0A835Y8E5_9CHLO|nr:hypothetical protein HYH03_003924 [Edaphochlamys debaryana]|eukprot:KAG2498167.1 hypothetical protein HYH03_003924 [Edaphochlamys debaryana]